MIRPSKRRKHAGIIEGRFEGRHQRFKDMQLNTGYISMTDNCTEH